MFIVCAKSGGGFFFSFHFTLCCIWLFPFPLQQFTAFLLPHLVRSFITLALHSFNNNGNGGVFMIMETFFFSLHSHSLKLKHFFFHSFFLLILLLTAVGCLNVTENLFNLPILFAFSSPSVPVQWTVELCYFVEEKKKKYEKCCWIFFLPSFIRCFNDKFLFLLFIHMYIYIFLFIFLLHPLKAMTLNKLLLLEYLLKWTGSFVCWKVLLYMSNILDRMKCHYIRISLCISTEKKEKKNQIFRLIVIRIIWFHPPSSSFHFIPFQFDEIIIIFPSFPSSFLIQCESGKKKFLLHETFDGDHKKKEEKKNHEEKL